ncbi:MAG: hypothetical protein JSW45_05090, partial [Thiotrichales bacterium]
VDYEQLSDELDHLSFEAVDYSFTEKPAEITGILEISGNKRRLVLKMKIPDTGLTISQQDLIELSATAELDPDDITHIVSASAGQQLSLCIKMQAARESVLPVPSADRPLMLSHYYH